MEGVYRANRLIQRGRLAGLGILWILTTLTPLSAWAFDASFGEQRFTYQYNYSRKLQVAVSAGPFYAFHYNFKYVVSTPPPILAMHAMGEVSAYGRFSLYGYLFGLMVIPKEARGVGVGTKFNFFTLYNLEKEQVLREFKMYLAVDYSLIHYREPDLDANGRQIDPVFYETENEVIRFGGGFRFKFYDYYILDFQGMVGEISNNWFLFGHSRFGVEF